MDRTESLKDLRRRFVHELEEIAQCPVCCERLEGPIPVCAQGHHVCIKCKPHTTSCPVCHSSFNGTRNYLAESVLTKFEEIKISLNDSDYKVNEKIVENKMYDGTQSPNMVKKNANEESPPSPILSPANQSKQIGKEVAGLSVIGKGKFPCRVGNCTDELPYSRMANHIRYLHEEFLIDVGIVQGNEYTNTWRILYQVNDSFDRAIYIYNMGIFFVKLVTNEEGDLYGCVQITNSRQNARYFQYKLEVGNKNTFVCFEGKVLGSRTVSQHNPKRGLSIHNSYVQHLLQKKKSYECILKITLLPEIPSCSEEASKKNNSVNNKRHSL